MKIIEQERSDDMTNEEKDYKAVEQFLTRMFRESVPKNCHVVVTHTRPTSFYIACNKCGMEKNPRHKYCPYCGQNYYRKTRTRREVEKVGE